MATSQTARAEQQEIIQTRDAKIAEINGYVDLTQEAKDRRINEINQWAASEVHAIQEEDKQRREKELAWAKKEVFRVSVKDTYSDAERSQVWKAFRSARAEVKAATTLSPENPSADEALTEILEEAERTGDYDLALAAYHRAIDLGVQSVVDRYLSTRPKAAEAWQRYTKAQEELNQSTGIGHLLASAYTERVLNS
jgi:tetratricopeptide (TPR) repeat protein